MSSEKKPKCVKPGCGALRLIGRPCADWDCPQHWIHHSDHEATIEALRAERDEADNALVDKYRDPKTGTFSFPGDVAAIVRRLDTAEAALARAMEARKLLTDWLGAKIASVSEEQKRSYDAGDDRSGELSFARHTAFLEAREVISRTEASRALLSDGGETPKLPADVVRLVIAAREVAYGDIETLARATDDNFKPLMDELDKSLEAFAARVEWDDEPSLDDTALQSGGPDA